MKISFKQSPSCYELLYIKWGGIGYDKEKLIKLIKRIRLLSILSFFLPKYKEELKCLKLIIHSYEINKLELLLNNDDDYSRLATIEKYSRIASAEVLSNGNYSKETLLIVTNLPPKDYKIFIKRVSELVNFVTEMSQVQDDKNIGQIPGL